MSALATTGEPNSVYINSLSKMSQTLSSGQQSVDTTAQQGVHQRKRYRSTPKVPHDIEILSPRVNFPMNIADDPNCCKIMPDIPQQKPRWHQNSTKNLKSSKQQTIWYIIPNGKSTNNLVHYPKWQVLL